MSFGYLPAHTKIPLQNLADVSSSDVSDGDYLVWSASKSKWEFLNTAPSTGDVFGPGSNTLNSVVLWNGTTGDLLKDDAEFLFDGTTDTLYASTIEKAPIAATDFNITAAVGGDITVAGYTGTNAGSVVMQSGDSTGSDKNGATVTLQTTGATAGSITMEGGLSSGEIAAPYIKLNGPQTSSNMGSIVARAGSKQSGTTTGYIFLKGGNAEGVYNGGFMDIRAGNVSGSGSAGEVSVAAGNIAAANATGGDLELYAGDMTFSAGDGDIDGGDITLESGNVAAGGGTLVPGNSGGQGSKMILRGAKSICNGLIYLLGGFNGASGATVSNRSQIIMKGYGTFAYSVRPYIRIQPYVSTNFVGTVTFDAGDAQTSATRGGNIVLTGGNFTSGSGPGGAVQLTSLDDPLSFGVGTGSMNFTCGDGGAGTGGSGGNVVLTGGAATNDAGGAVNITTGQGSLTSGSITFTCGDGGTTGGSVSLVAGEGSADGDLTIKTSGVKYFWPNSTAPGIFEILYVASTSSPNVVLGFVQPDADTIFQLGTQIVQWNNGSSLPAGTTTSGSTSVVGTLGTNASVYLQLTPDATGQSGSWQYDCRNNGDYNTAYSDNWEFRCTFYSSAVQGVNGADYWYMFAQSDGGTSGNTPFLTNGWSFAINEYVSGTFRHRVEVIKAMTVETTSYLGASSGGATYAVRIRKQGLNVLWELTGTGAAGNTVGGPVYRSFTLGSDITATNSHYIGMGAVTGGASALHKVHTFEFRQFPDNVPIVRKY